MIVPAAHQAAHWAGAPDTVNFLGGEVRRGPRKDMQPRRNPAAPPRILKGSFGFFRETLCEGKERWPWLRKPSANGQRLTRDRERRGENDKDDFTFGFRWLYLRGLE